MLQRALVVKLLDFKIDVQNLAYCPLLFPLLQRYMDFHLLKQYASLYIVTMDYYALFLFSSFKLNSL